MAPWPKVRGTGPHRALPSPTPWLKVLQWSLPPSFLSTGGHIYVVLTFWGFKILSQLLYHRNHRPFRQTHLSQWYLSISLVPITPSYLIFCNRTFWGLPPFWVPFPIQSILHVAAEIFYSWGSSWLRTCDCFPLLFVSVIRMPDTGPPEYKLPENRDFFLAFSWLNPMLNKCILDSLNFFQCQISFTWNFIFLILHQVFLLVSFNIKLNSSVPFYALERSIIPVVLSSCATSTYLMTWTTSRVL